MKIVNFEFICCSMPINKQSALLILDTQNLLSEGTNEYIKNDTISTLKNSFELVLLHLIILKFLNLDSINERILVVSEREREISDSSVSYNIHLHLLYLIIKHWNLFPQPFVC